MKLQNLLSAFVLCISLFIGEGAFAQTTVQIGTGSSSSSTRGPFQRADTNSSTVFSRWIIYYTEAEMTAAGVPNGASISQLNWELASSNIIIGTGDATLKIYVNNTNDTAAVSDTWANHISGATQVVDDAYNTTNNFPGANGWMPFSFSSPFIYTGGTFKIAVDWDCSQVTTPAFNGNGAIKFRWESTAPNNYVVKKTSSSSPSSTISDLRDERANIQIVFNAAGCPQVSCLGATNVTSSSADLSWDAAMGASTYNWKIVEAGAGSGAAAVDTGSTANTSVSTSGLSALTSYDLFVETDCGGSTSGFAGPYTFMTKPNMSLVAQIGMGSSSSSTRGPFQRSDTNSSTVFSRFVQIYTSAELAAAGIANGSTITEVAWELASSNVVIGTGNANLKVYVKNSSATAAMADDWSNLISGSTLLVDRKFNTLFNFPGANGWMQFPFSAPFVYTGGAIEVAVDWDCSGVSVPAFSGDGSLKWRWESTAPDLLVVKKTSSSSPSSNISDTKDERANIQFTVVDTVQPECNMPGSVMVTNVTKTSAQFAWSDTTSATFEWLVVAAGEGVSGVAIDGGTTMNLVDSTTSLLVNTDYDMYVRSYCNMGSDTSEWSGPHNFLTSCDTLDIGVTTVSDTSGGGLGSASIVVAGGTPPYTYSWDGTLGSADSTGLVTGTYNVTVLDSNGCGETVEVMVGDVVGIETEWLTKLRILPNPSSGLIQIDMEMEQTADITLSVYSIRGELIETLAPRKSLLISEKIDLTNYANGLYFVRISVDGQAVMKKVLLQK
ncbi:MAG: T9SS type A sorting domain-containing protein [Bacteroidota bacterium]